ncbi:organomercurial lyase [Amycolatopsis aidingensis]|uniref:organomercurial lyase n=1 Tax=Amycolatopsis aidingensis TaxID=2842453 RepID=UPI001C0AF017|nr:organomercurial lyase [Amycolatopsis aidingensis]
MADPAPREGVERILGEPTSERLGFLPRQARLLHRSILRRFAATGAPPARAELDAEARQCLRELAEWDLVGLGQRGEIEHAYPFATERTPHRVQIADGAQPYAVSALHALGAPAMLETDAEIVSVDPQTRRRIRVTVGDQGATADWQPATTVVFVGILIVCSELGDARACGPYTKFFGTRDSAETWAEARSNRVTGVLLDQDEALRAAERHFAGLLRRHLRSV